MAIENCAYCNGTGRDPNSTLLSGYRPCSVCKGHGERTIDVSNDQLKACPYCNGTGRDPNSTLLSGYKRCPTCGGWGQIVRSAPDLSKKEEPSLDFSKEFAPSSGQKSVAKRKVFIVHGRDKTPALELARFVEKRYPIDAILLEEQAHRGRTLIEKLEDNSDVSFAFITLTPDDVGALKGELLKERARQNVVFEWGHFIGKIGRKNVCLLIKGDVEIPSDLRGIGECRFNHAIKECFVDVENELRDARLI
jgi:hypothetical protein